MAISKEAQFFISNCFGDDGTIRAIRPFFDQKYADGEKMHKFTREVLNEMVATGKVKITYEGEKLVNINGVAQD